MKNVNNGNWPVVRKLFNNLHLWMGIGSGIILFIVCLSGTIYTFSSEIQEMLEPSKYKVSAVSGKEKLSTETIIAKVTDSLKGGTVLSVYIPQDAARTYQVSIKKEEKKDKMTAGNGVKPDIASKGDGVKREERMQKGEAKGPGKKEASGRPPRGTTYLVDPYTAEIKGTTEGPASGFFMAMFRMHRWLMLDTEVGRPIVGVATIIFTFIILTGLVIWFPQRIKSWKQGLKIKFSGNWKRINHDLHNSLGFYASFILLIMALTGLTWSFEWYRTGVNKMLGVYKSPDAKKEEPLKSMLPADSLAMNTVQVAGLIAVADQALPYTGDYRVTFAQEPDGVIGITKNRTGFFAPAAGDKLQLDRYSGQLLKKDIFRDKPLNERIAGSIKALHMGNIYGTFSKIIYFLACLIATSLPVTGTLIWINKLKKKPGTKERKPAAMSGEFAIN